MNSKFALNLLALLSLSACQATAQSETSLLEVTPQWTKLTDGSVFAITGYDDGQSEIATRCWLGENSQFTCLYVFDQNPKTDIVNVFVRVVDELPKYVWPLSGDGYQCAHTIIAGETIWQDGDILVSNHPSKTGKRWSASFADNFISENGVKGARYFNCLDILQAVRQGSLRTVGTKAVTREMVG